MLILALSAPLLIIVLVSRITHHAHLDSTSQFWAGDFSPNDNIFATVGGQGSPGDSVHAGEFATWDPKLGTGSLKLRQAFTLRSLAWSPNSKFVVLADFEGNLTRLDPMTGRILERLKVSKDMVNAVAISSDGALIASGSFDGSVTLWDTFNENASAVVFPHEEVVCLALSPHKSSLVVGTRGGRAYLVNLSSYLRSGSIIHVSNVIPIKLPEPAESNSIEAATFSSDALIFAIGYEGGFGLWDAATGESLRDFRMNETKITGLSFSRNGKQLATVDDSGILRLWDIKSNVHCRQAQAHLGGSFSVAFSNNGKTIATVGRSDFSVKIWDAQSLALIRVLRRDSISATLNTPKSLARAEQHDHKRSW